MAIMDASQSALDSLRTVEFRETLKGYHRDDVDEYLEKAAIEAEGLQEQLRQAAERLRQAGERISQLESALEQQPPPEPAEAALHDDTLQRTLLLAQKFVDETKADSEARAAKILADADSHAHTVLADAEMKAGQIAAESERRLREEISRLEGIRGQLSGDVESMARHLESERNRLRSALAEVIKWVDENVQPASTLAGRPGGGAGGQTPSGPPRGPQQPAGARPTSPELSSSLPVRNPAGAAPGEESPARPTGSTVRSVTASSLPLQS
jgi:DivIVA domain-containing protein